MRSRAGRVVADDARARAQGAAAAEGTLRARRSTHPEASLDLLENGCIGVMLWTWPDLSHGLVKVSSLATRLKIIAGVLTEALMGVLAAISLMRWRVRH